MSRRERSRALKSEASPIKSRLIQLCDRVEREGLAYDARQLWSIIARLEDWQNRP